MAKKAKGGDCYEAAGKLALEFIRGKHPKAELVHGVALNSLDYMPMVHACVEVGNTVYASSIRDNNNEGFNRMLYYMFEESGGNVPRLLSHYDIKIDLDDNGALENIEVIILETETSSE